MAPLILGLDPSLTAYGWAVLAVEASPRVVAVGCMRTKPDAKSRHVYQADLDGARVDELAAGLLEVLRTHHVAMVACEAPAGAQSAIAAKALGLAYGVTRAILVAQGRSVLTVQAHEAKRAVGGTMTATKAEVAAGVEALTRWRSSASSQPAREGEADAVAVALTALRSPACEVLRAFADEARGAT